MLYLKAHDKEVKPELGGTINTNTLEKSKSPKLIFSYSFGLTS